MTASIPSQPISRRQASPLSIGRIALCWPAFYCAALWVAGVCSFPFVSDASAADLELPTGVITLDDSGTLPGNFADSVGDDSIVWKSEHFVEPFDFPVSAVKAIKFPSATTRVKPKGDFLFELVSDDRVYGNLTDWKADRLTVDSEDLGKLTIPFENVRRIYRVADNPNLTYAGLAGLEGWKADGWQEDGVALWSEKTGAVLSGDLQVPPQAKIEFEVAWTGKPSFMMAIAADPNAPQDNTSDGWRFEVWGNILALVHEQDGVADVSEVETFKPERNRIHLIAYLDQEERILQVYTPKGQRLAKISTPRELAEKTERPAEPNRPARQGRNAGKPTGIRLVNLNGHTRIEQLQISKWTGQLPVQSNDSQISLTKMDGAVTLSDNVQFDPKKQSLTLTVPSPETATTESNQRQTGDTKSAPDKKSGKANNKEAEENGTETDEKAGEAEDQNGSPDTADSSNKETSDEDPSKTDSSETSKQTIALVDLVSLDRLNIAAQQTHSPVIASLQDGTRLSGSIVRVTFDSIVIRSSSIDQPVTLARQDIRTVQIKTPPATTEPNYQADPKSDDIPPPDSESTKGKSPQISEDIFDRVGRLELGDQTSSGRLVSGRSNERKSLALHWLPLGSRNPSPLEINAAGRLYYRDPAKPRSTAVTRAIQRREAANRRGLNFTELFLKRVNQTPASGVPEELNLDSHKIHLISGDVIPCDVKSINETTVTIKSTRVTATEIPNAKIQAIELIGGSSTPNLADAKRMRLLTLPRLQKNYPPTHLLCSKTGDFLRCRLRSLDDDAASVEVQLEEFELPTDRISQIIYLHPELMPPSPDEIAEMEAEAKAAAEEADNQAVATAEKDSPSIAADDAGTEANAGESTGKINKTGGEVADEIVDGLSFTGLVQVIKSSGNRVTFKASEVDFDTIIGAGDLIGDCKFNLGELDQVLIGQTISESASNLAYGQWRMTHAKPPLVAMDMGDSGPGVDTGLTSSLVGKAAPRLKLKLLGGKPFDLQKEKGRIVVLDFWASWCAPCMQTMPILDEAMAGYDPSQVMLISVNLQESDDQVRQVLERHDLDITVAMDIDGVAAGRFEANAIPQMVVVNPEGVVDRVFVGGGEQMVNQLTAAINTLLAGGE